MALLSATVTQAHLQLQCYRHETSWKPSLSLYKLPPGTQQRIGTGTSWQCGPPSGEPLGRDTLLPLNSSSAEPVALLRPTMIMPLLSQPIKAVDTNLFRPEDKSAARKRLGLELDRVLVMVCGRIKRF